MTTHSVHELITDPARASAYSRDDLTRLLIICTIALIGDPNPRATMDRVMSDALSTTDAARMLGISASTLSHRAHQVAYSTFLLPTGTRRFAFSRKAIEGWQLAGSEIHEAKPERRVYAWMKGKR